MSGQSLDSDEVDFGHAVTHKFTRHEQPSDRCTCPFLKHDHMASLIRCTSCVCSFPVDTSVGLGFVSLAVEGAVLKT